MAKSKQTPRLTPRGVRKNVKKQFSTLEKEVTKLQNKVASFEKELAEMSNGTIIDNAYRMDILRLRAQAVSELNSVKNKLSELENRVSDYNKNDEDVLRQRGLYWGA